MGRYIVLLARRIYVDPKDETQTEVKEEKKDDDN